MRGPIARALFGMDALEQADIDARLIELDGTPNKARLGGNATVAVSLAVAQAAALAHDMPLWRYLAGDAPVALPLPEIQIFGGGAHAGRRIDIQDLMVVPIGAWTFDDALTMAAEIYRAAGILMQEQGKLAGVADEGGWWPQFASNEEALEMPVRAIERAGCHPGSDAALSLDIAASEFGRDGRYTLGARPARARFATAWPKCCSTGSSAIRSFRSRTRSPRTTATAGLHSPAPRATACRSSATTTSRPTQQRIADARRDEACNAVLIKVNQAGTLTEAKAALDAGKDAGFGTIVSARSGESEDTAIAHLAVGWNAGQLKVGSFARSERMAKWNELLRIADELGDDARFAGANALPIRR